MRIYRTKGKYFTMDNYKVKLCILVQLNILSTYLHTVIGHMHKSAKLFNYGIPFITVNLNLI